MLPAKAKKGQQNSKHLPPETAEVVIEARAEIFII